MGDIEIKCAFTGMVSVKRLKELFNEFNANEHPEDQIEELVEQFKFQGIRHPAVLSKRTGLIIAGHGRVLAAERCGLSEFPVDEQHFENEAQEYAFLVADNTTQGWSRLNLSKIHKTLPNIEPFDIKRLAIKNFRFEPDPGSLDYQKEWQGMPEFEQQDGIFRTIKIHFSAVDAVADFQRLMNQSITEKTTSLWHPKSERYQESKHVYENES